VGTGEAINEEAATGEWDPYPERASGSLDGDNGHPAALDGDVINHQGKYYTLKVAKLYDLPPQPCPSTSPPWKGRACDWQGDTATANKRLGERHQA